jgi:hypothetical protein
MDMVPVSQIALKFNQAHYRNGEYLHGVGVDMALIFFGIS